MRPIGPATAHTIRTPTGSTITAAGIEGHGAAGDQPRRACWSWCGSTATCSAWACAARSQPAPTSELKERLLEARLAMQQRLADDAGLSRLVEPFDPERYNTNASLAENLLFGSPVGPCVRSGGDRRPALRARDLAGDRPARAISTTSVSASCRRWSSCSPICRPTTSTSGSSASSRPRTCRPTAACSCTRTRRGSIELSAEDQRLLLAPTFKLDRGPSPAGADHA